MTTDFRIELISVSSFNPLSYLILNYPSVIIRKIGVIVKKLLCCLIFFSVLFSCAYSKTPKKESQDEFGPGTALVRFYRGPLNHLSAVRYSECPMYPSCSEYSRQCFQKYGFLIGWMMTCDRLMRCGRDETKLSPTIFINRKWKFYDPPEIND